MLDTRLLFDYQNILMQWIKSICRGNGQHSLTLPVVALRARGWEGDQYVIVDDADPDVIIIRRMPGAEEIKRANTKRTVRTD